MHSRTNVDIICYPHPPHSILFPFSSRIRPLPSPFLQVHITTFSPITPGAFYVAKLGMKKLTTRKGIKKINQIIYELYF